MINIRTFTSLLFIFLCCLPCSVSAQNYSSPSLNDIKTAFNFLKQFDYVAAIGDSRLNGHEVTYPLYENSWFSSFRKTFQALDGGVYEKDVWADMAGPGTRGTIYSNEIDNIGRVGINGEGYQGTNLSMIQGGYIIYNDTADYIDVWLQNSSIGAQLGFYMDTTAGSSPYRTITANQTYLYSTYNVLEHTPDGLNSHVWKIKALTGGIKIAAVIFGKKKDTTNSKKPLEWMRLSRDGTSVWNYLIDTASLVKMTGFSYKTGKKGFYPICLEANDWSYYSPDVYYTKYTALVKALLAAGHTPFIVYGPKAHNVLPYGDYYDYEAKAKNVAFENNIGFVSCSGEDWYAKGYINDSTDVHYNQAGANHFRDIVINAIANNLTANAGVDKVICENDTSNIGVPSVYPLTYSWSSNPSGFSSTNANPSVSPTITTTYYLTVTYPSNNSIKDSVTITVNKKPVANAGTNQTICIGTFASIGSVPNDDNNYNWTSIPNGFSSNTSNPQVSPTSTTEYILNVVNKSGCSAKDTVTVFPITIDSITPVSSITINGSFTGINQPSLFLAITQNSINTTYQWQDSTKEHIWRNISNGTFNTLVYTPSSINDKIRCVLLSNNICTSIFKTYSNVISFTINGQSQDVKYYPNPVQSFLILDNLNYQWQSLQIANISGIQKIIVKDISGLNKTMIDVHTLTSGMYLMLLQNIKGEITHLKFIKE